MTDALAVFDLDDTLLAGGSQTLRCESVV